MPAPLALLVLLVQAAPSAPSARSARAPDAPIHCADCDAWNRPHPPVHVFGNTWWIGVNGLSVVAIDTGKGVILLDGALPQSVPHVKENLATAGLKLSDVKLIAASHTHFDHSGGIAELQRESGATVLASARSAEALRAGSPTPDDPQAAFGHEANDFAPVTGPIRIVHDGEVIKLGNVALTAHFTPGHTPGSTSWTWRSCEGKRCVNIAYADSLTPLGAGGFRFAPIAPTFRASIAKVAALPCDVLLTPHHRARPADARGGRREARSRRRRPLRVVRRAGARQAG